MVSDTQSHGGRIYSVPAGRAFLPALATAVLNGDLPRPAGKSPDPLDLPSFTILLPTRRAARALQGAFLDAARGRAMLLPRIRPIAEGEEDLDLLSGLAAADASRTGDADLPPAIGSIERVLVLTELVMRWSKAMRVERTGAATSGPFAAAGATTPAQAAKLAKELARLIDMVETENVSLAGLPDLVPDAFSEHWQKTLEFLNIVLDWWPAHLAEQRLMSPMDRRNKLILAEARRLAADRPREPIIVAGVTGSIPATVELMRAVLTLEQGAVLLPGLDDSLDDESWNQLGDHPEHPQHGLAKLLARLGFARGDVSPLPGTAIDISARRPAPHGGVAGSIDEPTRLKNRTLSEALRPAASTHRWIDFTQQADKAAIGQALDGVCCIEAQSAEDEAEAVALILREALETPGQTAALVSPDRMLARRVAARMERWGIRIDDSAGRPLGKTPPGAFLDLVVETAAKGFEPTTLVALLKHPLTRLGLDVRDVRRAARYLEILAFRTEYFGRDLAGVETALDRADVQVDKGTRRQRAIRRLWPDDWEAARKLVASLKAAFAPLVELASRSDHQPIGVLVAAHIAVAEALARLPESSDKAAARPPSPLWQGEAGETAALLMARLMDPALVAPSIHAADYPDFLRSLILGENVRQRLPSHPRLSIWGPLEARLQQPDVIILGSLNEGTWPEAAEPGPWLNRPMRQALGLPQPEEEIGRAAHDFTQLMGAGRVVLTRAQKVNGVPTIASRWLLRLQALLRGLEAEDALSPDKPWLGWAQARDATPERRTIKPPSPKPPISLRPRKLSVTDIERWIANPYAVFAGKILGLERLPDLGQEPGPALRGAVIHEALGRFAANFPGPLPGDIQGELLAIAGVVLAELTGSPRIAAFWVPRFERFAEWFAETEQARRDGARQTLAEIRGSLVLAAPAGPFTLTARADRIDVGRKGLIITDYKTAAESGLIQLEIRARRGEAPQLPLEATIQMAEGFPGIGAGPVTGLRYVSVSGGEPPGADVPIKTDDIAALAREAGQGLLRLISHFDLESTPYRAVRRGQFDYRYDDFAQLARVAEWISAESEEE